MRTLLGLILLALLLAGCATREPPPCPAPPGELLVPPQPLARLAPGPMSQQAAVEQWILDTELFQVQRSRYARLQLWGNQWCWKAAAIKGQ